MFARIRDLIFGYDICFLHAGNQFSSYLDSLANYLSHDNFRCYLEQVDGLYFKNKVTGNAINSSTMLVVLATEDGIHSDFLEKTIDFFVRCHKPVVAIDAGYLKDSQWYYLLKNQKEVAEKPSSLENSRPSNAVFDVISGSATFRVKNKILKQSNLFSVILVVISILLIAAASIYIHYLSDRLSVNRELVNASRLTVTREQENAKLAIAEAGKRQNEATIQSQLAFATRMAVESNNVYPVDPTRAIRYAEKGYRNFNPETENFPASILSSLYESFYDTYALNYTFYQKNITFNTPVNDFQQISGVNKLLVAGDDGKISIANQNGEIETTFDAHKRQVNKVTFSPVNQFILTTSDDNTANLLTINGELIKKLPGHQDDITFGTISPQGERLLTLTDDSLRLWDNKGNLIVALGEDGKIINHAVFSPVEGIIAAAFDDKIKLIDFRGNTRREFNSHEDEIIRLSYSVNGSRIASASYDSTAIIWSKGGGIIKKLSGHNGIVNAALFSPDRTKVITVSDDQTAKLWTWDGEFIKTLAGHTGAVIDARFSPNSSFILTVSLDNTVKIWDNIGNHLHTLKAHKSIITKAEFSADSKTVISAAKDGTIKIWPVDTQLLTSMDVHSQGVKDVFYGPEEKNILTLSGRGVLRIWDPNGKMINSNFAKGVFITSIVKAGKGNFLGIFDGTVKKMNASGAITDEWGMLGKNCRRLAISGDQNEIAVLTADNLVKIHSIPKDTLMVFRDTTLIINDIKYDDNMGLVVATSKGVGQLKATGFVNRMDLENQPVKKILKGEGDNQFLLIGGNGQLLLADNELRIKQQLAEYSGNITAAVSDSAYQLVFAGTDTGELLIFDYSGKIIANAGLHQAAINQIRLSGDKKHLLTASEDNSAKICPTAAGIVSWLESSKIADFGE